MSVSILRIVCCTVVLITLLVTAYDSEPGCELSYPKKEMELASFPIEGRRKPLAENKSKPISFPVKVREWAFTPELAAFEKSYVFYSKIQYQIPINVSSVTDYRS